MPPENSSQQDLPKASPIPDMLDAESSPPSAPVPPKVSTQIPSAPVIQPTPAIPEPAQAPIDATDSGYLKQIRTYQGDIAEALHNEDASLVSIRAAEKARQDLLKRSSEERPESSPEDAAENSRRIKSIFLFFGSVLLLGAAGYAGWYSYNTYLTKTAVPAIIIPDNRFLPVATTTDVSTANLSRQTIISLIQNEAKRPLASGNIEHIELRKGTLRDAALMTTTEFLIAIEAKPPGSLVRAFDPLFMLGILGLPAPTEDMRSAPILLVKLDSYENAYAGMLDWEKGLKDDILPLFAPDTEVANVSPDASFSDLTVKNKDARVLRDNNGQTALIYSFYNQKLLIITTSESALRTLLAELDTQALAR
jgi:hypothetical protein